ncbi:UNVERIFIED_ORG: ATP-binding cassette subfamily B protein [Xanthobacter viscosus]|jgi:ATP-binding cassette subfamily B protein|uniref:Glucan ABC transporter ATP-binding protein/ permease n=1 Tax=Xanthobacter autotrophicus TaxID=280 RepID=A0A6C1KK82_XANAU|nr:glucan ABC transporter ATP-binding protein/ permease [Xanthobacter autotrophicus]TLX44221.1 glucan ABC transporter ATP-binding protein/ permease [Xanthobacter autotrophicus]
MSLFRVYARTIGLLGPEARLGAVLVISNLLLAIAQFAEPILFGRIVDTLAATKADSRLSNFGDLTPLLAAWVGFGLFNIGAGVLISLHADRLSHRRRLGILTQYFEHVLQLPLSFHGETHSGRLLKVMLEGVDSLWGLWLSFFRQDCAAIISLVVLVPVGIWINWRLGLVLIVLMAVFGIVTGYVIRRTEAMQREVEEYNSDLAERTSDALGNVAVIQSYTRTEAEVTGLKDTVKQVLAVQIPVLSWWAMVSMATKAATTLTILAILLIGTWLYLHDMAAIGDIVTYVAFANMLIGRLDHTVSFFNQLIMSAPQLAQFFEVLDTVGSVRDRPGAKPLPQVVGDVVFDDVSFSYDGKRTAVEDVSFHAAPGQTFAFVGTTGAGKSTALALLHRVFDPQSGSIRVDGVDIRDVTLSSLRHAIGVVFQEPLLFNRSIEDNLRVGKPDATEAEMREALSRAQALELVERNPLGLKAVVGERGRALSGGERQRLSIARALLKNPPILILDEATSALDAATEVKVQAALDEVMKDRTTLVIAHRLATVRNADRILVFERGCVVEAGTFDELVQLGGRFAALASAQFMTGGPDAAHPVVAHPIVET